MKFSERYGYTEIKNTIQIDSMTIELRNTIWSLLYILFFDNTKDPESENLTEKITLGLFFSYFKEPLDRIPIHHSHKVDIIRDYFFKSKWYEVYDLLSSIYEFIPKNMQNKFEDSLNRFLERELSGYRFIDGICTPITDEQELNSIQKALDDPEFPGVKAHFRQALELLSDRENPDYRNSIKESISAVESIASIIAKKPNASLGDALKIIEKDGKLHPSLKDEFSKLYGYTSNAEGIRHSMMEEPNISVHDAIYFMVTCAAFVNYLKAKL